jgi:catechol-2,3-dioxygenase
VKYQPAKIAAVEGHWDDSPGKSVPLVLFGLPDMNAEITRYSIEGFDHHVALYMESDEILQYYKNRLDAANIPNSYVDYIVYHSLYVNDPNGLNLEFCANPPITADYELKAELVAHRDLKTWVNFAHNGQDTK